MRSRHHVFISQELTYLSRLWGMQKLSGDTPANSDLMISAPISPLMIDVPIWRLIEVRPGTSLECFEPRIIAPLSLYQSGVVLSKFSCGVHVNMHHVEITKAELCRGRFLYPCASRLSLRRERHLQSTWNAVANCSDLSQNSYHLTR